MKNHWSPARIRALRDALGWSQNDLAQYLGVGQVSVWRWEKGKANLARSNRTTLARLEEEAKANDLQC